MLDTKEIYRNMEAQYFGEHMHERKEIEALPGLLTGVKTFVDVGCSLGQYSHFAGKVLRHATFYCIEPDVLKVKRLKELTNDWEKGTGNSFHVINKAVADQEGVAKFFVPSDHTSSGALFVLESERRTRDDWVESEVPCTTLDNLLEGVEVDFVKIDVEGGEYRVLMGAKKLLESGGPKFFLEVAPWGDLERSYKPSSVFELMGQYGYNFQIVGNHWLFYKTNKRSIARMKNFLMGFVVDHPQIKNALKRFLFLARKLKFH